MSQDSKLIPIMREGIDVIKMVFFQRLKAYLTSKYTEKERAYINQLAGAIINETFGNPSREEPFATFARENKAVIEEEMRELHLHFEEMLIPLTDALRVQVLCDYQEGTDSSPILIHAQELGLLLVDREVPLPSHFITLVRKLGSYGSLLVPM
jgi:hypothetical protein